MHFIILRQAWGLRQSSIHISLQPHPGFLERLYPSQAAGLGITILALSLQSAAQERWPPCGGGWGLEVTGLKGLPVDLAPGPLKSETFLLGPRLDLFRCSVINSADIHGHVVRFSFCDLPAR